MVFKTIYPLILGSTSPRRKEILSLLGLNFSIQAPSCDETYKAENFLDPFQITAYLAEKKALSISAAPDHLVLGVDTLVYLDGKILGKPQDKSEALSYLKLLNNRVHIVASGVALCQGGTLLASGHELTQVQFGNWSLEVLSTYAQTTEPLDKAGAYAIQGQGAFLTERINGCFYNIMGLPLAKTLAMLKPFLN